MSRAELALALRMKLDEALKQLHYIDNRAARRGGFRDQKEFRRVIAQLPLFTEAQVKSFFRWQQTDGTKAGLMALLDGPIMKI